MKQNKTENTTTENRKTALNKTVSYEWHTHEFPPLFDENSRVLILGSFPSVKSREQQFFYGHAQNRFWKIMAALTEEPLPETVEQKRALARRHRIALWDVIDSCRIAGSSDASIRDAMPTDLSKILDVCDIKMICTNGALAGKLYAKYQQPLTGREAIRLPSTSPANAAWSLERLLGEWSVLREYLSEQTGEKPCKEK